MKIIIFIYLFYPNSKNEKIWNLIFLSILPIQDLSCKFDHSWKKKLDFNLAYPCIQNTEAWLGGICRSAYFNICILIEYAYIKIQFFFSKVVKFTWKMQNRLNRKRNQISESWFSSYREKFIENSDDDVTKMTITRKIKIGNFLFFY